ncbi:MAG: hypothetical protein V1492_03140 [Candidatus Micrarchaeota archaeon]
MMIVMNVYRPQKKIVVALSFEGVLNNGVKECAFVSLNAYKRMIDNGQIRSVITKGGFFRKILEPDEFIKNPVNPLKPAIKDSAIVAAFVALRPLVAVAEDYYTVLQVINVNHEMAVLLGSPKNIDVYRYFIDKFEALKSWQSTAEERQIFKKEFYAERERIKQVSYEKWLSLQEPYKETIEQLRALAKTREFESGELARGFELYYLSAKDEGSIKELCNFYTKFGHLLDIEVGQERGAAGIGENVQVEVLRAEFLQRLSNCIVHPDHIIGLKKNPGGDKLLGMKGITEEQGVPPAQVWNVNDRLEKPEEIKRLKDAGFVNQFILTGGYAFPWEYDEAPRYGVHVLQRPHMAVILSTIAGLAGF